jgi:hypothetical protein
MGKGRLALGAVTAAIALAGCGSSSTPKGYVKAPTRSCAATYATAHHIAIAAARNVKCSLVWAPIERPESIALMAALVPGSDRKCVRSLAMHIGPRKALEAFLDGYTACP